MRVWRPASYVQQSVHTSNRPVDIGSALQFALNLFQLGSITEGENYLACQDHADHVNEGLSRDVSKFSEHLAPASRLEEFALLRWICKSHARAEHR